MFNKKVQLILTISIMTIVWLLFLSLSETLGTIMGIVFMMVYVGSMINALRDPKATRPVKKISPAYSMKKIS